MCVCVGGGGGLGGGGGRVDLFKLIDSLFVADNKWPNNK